MVVVSCGIDVAVVVIGVVGDGGVGVGWCVWVGVDVGMVQPSIVVVPMVVVMVASKMMCVVWWW